MPADLQGATPKAFATSIAMTAVKNAATAIDESNSGELTKAQRTQIHNELARIYNRLGERWEKLANEV